MIDTIIGNDTLLIKQMKSLAMHKIFSELTVDEVDQTIKDQGGNNWTLETWANRVLRETIKSVAQASQTELMRQYDMDLVFITAYGGASDLCIHGQGKKYSEFGKTPGYPLLADYVWGTAKGKTKLFHPNCYHNKEVFIEGYSEEILQEYLDNLPSEDEIRKNSQEQAKRRYNERELRKCQKNINATYLAYEYTDDVDLLGQDKKYQRLLKRREELLQRDINIFRVNNYHKFDEVNEKAFGLT